MEKLCLFLIFAVLSSQALGMYRNKRQSGNKDDDGLEDKYGWNWPTFDQGAFNQGAFNQGAFNQRPWRNPFPGVLPDPTTFAPQVPAQTQATPSSNTNQNGDNQAATRACIRSCPVTSEYNPVCGTNGVTYDNPGRLLCAQACGISVTQLRSSRCPVATTTSAPAS